MLDQPDTVARETRLPTMHYPANENLPLDKRIVAIEKRQRRMIVLLDRLNNDNLELREQLNELQARVP